jgi:hypothetical protein
VSKGGTGVGTLTGLVKGNGTSAFSAAVAGTDYVSPGGTETLTNKTLQFPTIQQPTVSNALIISGSTAGGTLGPRITADFSNGTSGMMAMFQSSTTNGKTDVTAIPNGTGTRASWGLLNSSDTVNAGFFTMLALSTDMRLWSGKLGTGTVLPMTFYVDNAEAARFDTSGNFAGQDKLMTRVMFQDTGWDYFDSSTTSALDYVNGSYQRWAPTASSNPTLTISNWPPSGNMGELLVAAVNLGAAGTITFPTANWIKSDGSFAASPSAAGVTLQSSGTDFILFWTSDASTTLYAKVVR